MSAILAVVGSFIQLLVLILGQFFDSKARAREIKEKYEKRKKEFDEAVRKALAKTLENAKSDSGDANDLEDKIDERLGRDKKD